MKKTIMFKKKIVFVVKKNSDVFQYLFELSKSDINVEEKIELNFSIMSHCFFPIMRDALY